MNNIQHMERALDLLEHIARDVTIAGAERIAAREQAAVQRSWIEHERDKRAKRNRARREREQSMKDLGLVKVRGNLGGTYWE